MQTKCVHYVVCEMHVQKAIQISGPCLEYGLHWLSFQQLLHINKLNFLHL